MFDDKYRRTVERRWQGEAEILSQWETIVN
jgi:hypothetical protein